VGCRIRCGGRQRHLGAGHRAALGHGRGESRHGLHTWLIILATAGRRAPAGPVW
jgi:hypothetical protein